jgi:hypothetical protein
MTLEKMPLHHVAWLSNHPNRSVEWFKEMCKQGFDVHHVDGDHSNNDPDNLVFIEHRDHMRLHGSSMEASLRRISRKGKKNTRKSRTARVADRILKEYERTKAKNWGLSTTDT